MYTYSRRSSSISPLIIVVPALLVLIIAVGQMLRGLPAVAASVTIPSTTTIGELKQLQLPTAGSTSVSVVGLGQVGSAGTTAARPIASVTKMMTAWVVLKDHPLSAGEAGPPLTTTSADAARYLQMVAQDQSSVAVTAGMTFSEFEMLEGMLIPSANNFAEMLAAWDAGSQAAFVQKMNAEAQALGMTNTRYADASGFSSSSVSTALDQLALERQLMQNPVFAQIVAMPQARLPGVGLVTNVNELLGQDGIIGIKTGFTEDAGGNLAFAARKTIGLQQVDIIGAVLGQVDRPAAFDATRRILSQLSQSLQLAKVVPAGLAVATINPAWGDKIDIVAGADAQMLYFPGMTLESTVEIDSLKAPLRAGDQVGWLNLKLGEQTQRVPLKLAADLPKAGIVWKLTRT